MRNLFVDIPARKANDFEIMYLNTHRWMDKKIFIRAKEREREEPICNYYDPKKLIRILGFWREGEALAGCD